MPAKNIILFVETYYNDLEFWYPKIRLTEAGASVIVAGPKAGGEYKSKYGMPAKADIAFADLDPDTADALVIPGGYAPDMIRRDKDALAFTRAMHEMNKPVAFICHAGWVPVSAGIVQGRTVTSFFAIKDDLVNAGAEWVDEAVVVDGNLITSRTPDDLPAFCRELVKMVGLA
ncbi:MAG: type 1 glutamine amidotransferase domain-containing protein [Desulfovibrionaceae bacterium]